MTSIFDYVCDQKYYTADELNKMIDCINAKERKVIKNRIRALVRQADAIYQQISSIFTKQIQPKIKDFVADMICYLNNMTCIQLSEYKDLPELLNEYNELKLLITRVRDWERIKLRYVTAAEVLNWNLKQRENKGK